MPLPGQQDERKWVSNLYARPQSTLKIGGGPVDSQTTARNIVARQKGQPGAKSSNINDYFAMRNQEKARQSTRLAQEASKKNKAAQFGQKYDDMHKAAQVKLQQKWAMEDEAKAAAERQKQWEANNPRNIKATSGVNVGSANGGGGGQVFTGNEARDQVLGAAAAMVGTPYAWGGGGYGVAGSAGGLNGPGGRTVVGFDCSGLVSYALSTMGIKLPARQSEAILGSYGSKTSFANAAPGDLVGWYDNSKDGYKRHIALKYSDTQIIESTVGGVRIRNIGGGYDKGIFAVHLNY